MEIPKPTFNTDQPIEMDLTFRFTSSGLRNDKASMIDALGLWETSSFLGKEQLSLSKLATHKPVESLLIEPFDPKVTLAKVNVIDSHEVILPLEQGTAHDRMTWVGIPPELMGFGFSKHAHPDPHTLKFEITEPGVAVMAALADFGGGGGGGNWREEVAYQRDLEAQGWRSTATLVSSDSHGAQHKWIVFKRDCKAGESFAYRTHKYNPPFIITKLEKGEPRVATISPPPISIEKMSSPIPSEKRTYDAVSLLASLKPVNDVTIKSLRPGLRTVHFPRQASQEGKGEVWHVEFDRLGESVGMTGETETLSPWRYPMELNATAAGYLRVPKSGEYAFRSYNYYDRNLLVVAGKTVCKYRDLDRGEPPRIQLEEGYVSIVSVGYVHSRGSVEVTWIPPGETELRPIPADLLFHLPAE